LAKITPQREQASSPGFAWPQRGQAALEDGPAFVGDVAMFFQPRW